LLIFFLKVITFDTSFDLWYFEVVEMHTFIYIIIFASLLVIIKTKLSLIYK